jgi:aminopeptidase N
VLFQAQFNPGDDLLRRTRTDAPDLASRSRAAGELLRTGTRAHFRAVGEAMRKEPFWGVRVEVARALAASGSAEAVAPLAAMLRAEPHARARLFVAQACGRIRDPRLRDALCAFLDDEPAPSPWARRFALEALGMQRDPRDHERLVRAAAAEGRDHQSVGASGALRGLGHLRTEEALAELERRLPYGAEPELTRAIAVEAYGGGARFFRRDVREESARNLGDLTRDPNSRVRMRAGAQLATLGLPAGIAPLETLRRRQSHRGGACAGEVGPYARGVDPARPGRDGLPGGVARAGGFDSALPAVSHAGRAATSRLGRDRCQRGYGRFRLRRIRAFP